MSQCLFSFGKEGSVWYCIKERGHEDDHAFNARPDWTPETPRPGQTVGEQLLASLAMQLHAGIADRDRWWADYRRHRSRVVVVRDDEQTGTRHVSIERLPTPNGRDEIVKILRGALAQSNIGAARPLIKSAIEKLGQ